MVFGATTLDRKQLSLIVLTSLVGVTCVTEPAAHITLFAQEATQSAAEVSYIRLADPKTAEALKLTDEQRLKVADLMAQRANELGNAAPTDRAGVLARFEKGLSDVLTDEQRAQLIKQSSDLRLKFNFRFQRWAEVLDWYAKQCDLSLVIDAPPPGTFNYSDTKDYSQVEAMDLLNSVLSTKGYTLIRRDRMLLVIDLQEGLPEGLIPRVEIADLDKRGKFEIVSVIFPLGDLDPAAVKTEITPLLGTFGTSVSLPLTKQLLVTDAAGVIRAISAVIASMPKTPATTATAAAPPELAVFPVSAADAKVAEEVLVKMFPAAKVVADIKAQQINAFATPTELAAIKGVVEQMQAHNPPDKKPRLEVYPVRTPNSAQLVANLALVAPLARITFDAREQQIVAFGSPEDQANLKASIEKLSAGGTVEQNRQMEIYPLFKADPTSTVTLLQAILPQARFTVDPQTRRLVVIGSPDDQKAIKAILEQLQSTTPGPETQTLQFYPLERSLPATAITTLTTLAPKAQIVANTDGRQLQVLANTADHAVIRSNLDELQKGLLPPEKRLLVIYPVTAIQRTRFRSVMPSLTTDFPDIRIVPETDPTEVAIWAKVSQHEILRTLMESMKSDVADEARPQLVIHPLREADPTTAISILKSLVPAATVSLDAVNRQVVAIATTDDQAAIKASLEKLQPNEMGRDAPVVRFYPLEQPLPATTIAAFAKLVPKATVTSDTEGKWLQVVATQVDHRLVKSNLDEIVSSLPSAEKRKLVVYAVTPAQRLRFQTLLPTLTVDFPDIRTVADAGMNEISIWAKPTQHVVLKGVLDELKREVPADEKNRLVSYPLKFADPTATSTALQLLFPGAKITVDATTNRLLIWTRPDDHPAIKQAIDELDGEKLSENQEKVSVYPVPEIDLDVALGLLQGMLPKVKMLKDTKAKTIVAWGRKTDQLLIERTLNSMRSSADGDQKARLKIYPAGRVSASSMIDVLRSTLPNARLAIDPKTGGLAALGTAADHAEIQSALSQMNDLGTIQHARLATYTLSKIRGSSAVTLFGQAVPEARVSVGQDPTQLIVWAKNEDHAAIERIVEQLEDEAAATPGLVPKSYFIRTIAAATAIPLFNRVVPKAVLNPGTDPNRLIAFASPADHAVIDQVIKQLDVEHGPGTSIEFYDVFRVDADAALRLVQAVLQKHPIGTSVALIPGTNQLYVEARPDQHEMIQTALSRLKTTAESGLEVFQLDIVDPIAAESMIRRMFSGTRLNAPIVEPDGATQKLYVRGTKDQIQRVRELLEKMGETSLSTGTGTSNRRVRVIPFNGDTEAAIQEIQRIWPKLRSNELRVIPTDSLKSNQILPRSIKDSKSSDAKEDSGTKVDVPLAPVPDKLPANSDGGKPDASQNRPKIDDQKTRTPKPIFTGRTPAESGITLAQATDKPESAPADDKNAAPIVIMPRDGTITLFSDDPDALDQLDKLLRAVSPPSEVGGRGFAVYALKYAGATSVAETVRQSLRIQNSTGGSRFGQSGPTVVADERLNAIVVHASRADRVAIERLIETLDSSEIQDSFTSNKPRRVPVKNGSAAQIEQVLRLVYKAQLSTGGGRKELPIPSGLDPQIAATLQQLNAMNTGPLLTLSVDDATNAIVIMAPTTLAEQVTALIEELDRAALTENSQTTNIISTQRMSSARAQKVLNLILEKSRRQGKR